MTPIPNKDSTPLLPHIAKKSILFLKLFYVRFDFFQLFLGYCAADFL
jgi:hypothetical protein